MNVNGLIRRGTPALTIFGIITALQCAPSFAAQPSQALVNIRSGSPHQGGAPLLSLSHSMTKTAAKPAAGSSMPKEFSGKVSWYGQPFHGRKTASGEIFDMYKCSAAHLKLPFFTKVLVEDPRTGNTVIVKVNDRGPYARDRVMDLSREAARRVGILLRGVAYVDCLVLDHDDDANTNANPKSDT
ncbi:MAG TPA: septal ring lytic transglycosylase RlpA family protein [Candidatus Obscuribacterales bacterium]